MDFKIIEKSVNEFWAENKVYEKLFARKGKNFYVLDGPPYANNIPHVGHIKNTIFKDLLIRLNFMKGYNVLFNPGFDTHGLPIENVVEKKLGLQSKKDIEKFGTAKFMIECKNNATLNKEIWMRVYKKLGSLYALRDKPYMTYDNSYIESGWWAFGEMHKKGLIYEGEKPVMWCPHCETSLAGYEVSDSYKDVRDPGVYVLFKLKDEESNLLVYTTTPWTLPANVAIAVAPNENYVKVDIAGMKVILAEARLQKLSEMGFGYNLLETFKGKKLVGEKYLPLLDVPLQKELQKGKLGKALEIVASIPLLKERVASKVKAKKGGGEDLFEEFVTMNEGTGLVHCAPGHGKTDNMVGQFYKLAAVSPVDDQAKMTEKSGFSGFVKSADKDIIETLEKTGKLLFKEDIVHSYPLCWRCKSPLIFRLSKQLFLKVEKIKKTIQKENEKVSWLPEFARDKFDNWVENAEDWNISRQRYWGIPIPLWKCSCGEEKVITNKAELEKLSKQKIEDLHAVDHLEIQCPKCKKQMHKVKGILDVWFDSGIAPWASLGYPMQSKELFEKNFPIGRINEAQDQIRGWFYALMACSCAVFGKKPYEEVSMTGWVLDKNGNKMSKSAGNYVDAEGSVDELGADVLRYYFCWDVAPYDVQKFNIDTAKKEMNKVFMVLSNLPNLCMPGKKKDLDLEDKWILSRLESVTGDFQHYLDKFEFNTAFRSISDFIINDLSRDYIQMTRDKENGQIISECLERLLLLLAPAIPYLSEYIWQKLREKKIVHDESVIMCSWPKTDSKRIDRDLEKSFKSAAKVIEAGMAKRDEAKIGLKWPLASATIYSEEDLNNNLQEIIARQLNVKKIIAKGSRKIGIEVELDLRPSPELEAEGFAREIARKIQAERKNSGLQKGDLIELKMHVDENLRKMLEPHHEFLRERTNSSKFDLVDAKSLTGKAIVFTVKDKKILFEFRNY